MARDPASPGRANEMLDESDGAHRSHHDDDDRLARARRIAAVNSGVGIWLIMLIMLIMLLPKPNLQPIEITSPNWLGAIFGPAPREHRKLLCMSFAMRVGNGLRVAQASGANDVPCLCGCSTIFHFCGDRRVSEKFQTAPVSEKFPPKPPTSKSFRSVRVTNPVTEAVFNSAP